MGNSIAYIRGALIALPFAGMLAGAAMAETPLSASDWLSGSVKGPARESSAWRPGDPVPPSVKGQGNPQPVAESGAVGEIKVTRLDGSNPDLAGTITARKAGLPRDLWKDSDVGTIAEGILQSPTRLPAMSALLQRILIAQLQPPQDSEMHRGTLFLARTDRLLDMGALDQARDLIMAAGGREPEQFRRLFDIALLEGEEAQACERMVNTPGIAPSLSARIFCLAQSGDWAAAAIGLNGGEDLGLIDEPQVQLLTHFLHDSYVDSGEQIPLPDHVTPLEFRMHEAIGQPLPTQHLPLAFALSDLRANSGWKARLEAAERLARAGAISPERLRQIYAEQKPAASGGVWERASAMRTLEAAMAAGDLANALPHAFAQFRAADMADVLAAMVAADLPSDVAGNAGEIATWLRQWQGLDAMQSAEIAPELQNGETEPPAGRRGEALLEAMADIDAGLDGDLARAAEGLAMMRALGLNSDADLAAAQLTLLPQMKETPG
ncbi:hypothetical protein [Paracoccus onubensis]|uniref:Antifreeze glycopeptide n=1 Tax=Paracoccus onubensis TaxID=1675788 RepID=A0A418SWJ1_9RHOB|nr:hypothetical protein [Paracoccus onubensis]RJE85248.1 hypothetical protein D3P04_09510 [Paracoccus onubensis]